MSSPHAWAAAHISTAKRRVVHTQVLVCNLPNVGLAACANVPVLFSSLSACAGLHLHAGAAAAAGASNRQRVWGWLRY